MVAATNNKMQTSLRGRCFCISAAVACGLIILGYSSPIQGNPLVYPNRFNFQKTTTTSTTQIPLHDHSNNSSSLGEAGSNLPSSYGQNFRYDIAAWVIGALLLVCLLFVILYPRTKRRTDLSSSSPTCCPFPVSSHLKADLDSASIIGNTNSDNIS